MIWRLAFAGAAGVSILALGAYALQSRDLASLQAELDAQRLLLASCNARAANITEDKESDDAIDRIPDADLPNIPERWLRP